MAKTINYIKHPAKLSVVANIANVPLGQAEIGEMFYCLTNNRLYVRIVSGWKYASMT
uniref:Uncharacterized protein n=1 Tax=viral metagenome TaxID=1070528 RepID=A0A6M3IPW0_9ZZZZ